MPLFATWRAAMLRARNRPTLRVSALNSSGLAAFRRIHTQAPCITDYVLAYPFLKFASLFKNPKQLQSPELG